MQFLFEAIINIGVPLFCLLAPTVGLIWWQANKKRRSGLSWNRYFQQQGYEAQVKKAQRQDIIGYAQGRVAREAVERNRRKGY